MAPSTTNCPCCSTDTGVEVGVVDGIGGTADDDVGMVEKSILNCSGSVGSRCSLTGANW